MTGVLAVALTGCATILSGTSQKITVHTDPQGAHARIGHQAGRTPVTLTVPKGGNVHLEVTVDHNKRIVPLKRTFDQVGLLNILFFPGFIVDAVSGAMMKYEPEVVSVDLISDSLTSDVYGY
jgi:hypothetical protein